MKLPDWIRPTKFCGKGVIITLTSGHFPNGEIGRGWQIIYSAGFGADFYLLHDGSLSQWPATHLWPEDALYDAVIRARQLGEKIR